MMCLFKYGDEYYAQKNLVKCNYGFLRDEFLYNIFEFANIFCRGADQGAHVRGGGCSIGILGWVLYIGVKSSKNLTVSKLLFGMYVCIRVGLIWSRNWIGDKII